ncbi:MAG: hypothetical protein CW346_03325 [Bacillaceae bacterium]|nr:hypothetical protein [Bacillaceae bacterium]
MSVFPAGPGRRRRSGDCRPKRTAKGASSSGAENTRRRNGAETGFCMGIKENQAAKRERFHLFRFAAGEIRESRRAAINFPEAERRIFGKSFRKTAGTGMARVANGAGRPNASFEHHQTGKGSA